MLGLRGCYWFAGRAVVSKAKSDCSSFMRNTVTPYVHCFSDCHSQDNKHHYWFDYLDADNYGIEYNFGDTLAGQDHRNIYIFFKTIHSHLRPC